MYVYVETLWPFPTTTTLLVLFLPPPRPLPTRVFFFFFFFFLSPRRNYFRNSRTRNKNLSLALMSESFTDYRGSESDISLHTVDALPPAPPAFQDLDGNANASSAAHTTSAALSRGMVSAYDIRPADSVAVATGESAGAISMATHGGEMTLARRMARNERVSADQVCLILYLFSNYYNYETVLSKFNSHLDIYKHKKRAACESCKKRKPRARVRLRTGDVVCFLFEYCVCYILYPFFNFFFFKKSMKISFTCVELVLTRDVKR